jgi:hypothetical protein
MLLQTMQHVMSVGSVGSSGGDPVLMSALAAQAGASDAAMRLLSAALEMVQQQNAQLLESMRAASPPGIGDSIDTWA